MFINEGRISVHNILIVYNVTIHRNRVSINHLYCVSRFGSHPTEPSRSSQTDGSVWRTTAKKTKFKITGQKAETRRRRIAFRAGLEDNKQMLVIGYVHLSQGDKRFSKRITRPVSFLPFFLSCRTLIFFQQSVYLAKITCFPASLAARNGQWKLKLWEGLPKNLLQREVDPFPTPCLSFFSLPGMLIRCWSSNCHLRWQTWGKFEPQSHML